MGFLRLATCASLPERPDPPNVLEYTAAEWWVREQYVRYFREQHRYPQLVTWQLQRLVMNYDTADPVLDLVMTVLEHDFRNALSPRLVRKFLALEKSGAPQSELLALLKEISPGGALKPDMMGISSTSVLEFDGVEVGTVKTAKGTWDELNYKLGIVNTVILPQVKLELPNLAISMSRGFKSIGAMPTSFTVKASSFRLAEYARIVPLPVRIGETGTVQTADWICFHPTAVWYPPGTPQPSPTAVDPEGTDGLVIYHIHRAPLPQLPKRVRTFLEGELRKWRQQEGLVLELNPAHVGVFRDSKSDWAPEAQMLFGYFGLTALVVMGVALAWEVGLIAGGAALAVDGLAALAGSAEALGTAIAEGAAFASRLWPVAVSAASLLPVTARQ